jgi:hypothetical protein
VEEISQGAKILDATVGALLDVLAEEVGGAAGPQGIAYALNNVTKVRLGGGRVCLYLVQRVWLPPCAGPTNAPVTRCLVRLDIKACNLVLHGCCWCTVR